MSQASQGQQRNMAGPGAVRDVPSVNAKHFSFYKSRQVEIVENFHTVFPGVGVAVLSDALLIEAVHLRDLPRLVVAAKQRNAVGMSRLEAQQ